MLHPSAAGEMLYVAVIAITTWLPGIRSTLGAGAATSALTILGYAMMQPADGLRVVVMANHGLALFALWVTVAVVWHQKRNSARRDLTEARAARSERQFRRSVEDSPTGMLLVDDGGLIALANREAERLFGYSRDTLLGQPIEILVPEIDLTSHEKSRALLAAEPESRRMGGGREILGIDKEGHTLSLEVGLAKIESPDGDFVLATVTDAGFRNQLELARGAQTLARGLIEAEEAQRKRMAREIHDALGQGLTALKLDIGWLAERLPEEPANLHERVIAIEELATRTIEDVRRLSAELRPALLDDQGLLAAMRWQVADFEKRSGLRCSLDLPDAEIDWEDDRCTVAYRVLQESLTNVIRHARARSVNVTLVLEPQGDVVLQVRDDGCGFSPEQAARPDALGLVGMRERARLLGGSLIAEGVIGAGSAVTLRMPCGRVRPSRPAEFPRNYEAAGSLPNQVGA